jgi:hypothetical protein
MTEKKVRAKRFYVLLPVLVLPFVTITFWVMGGGRANGNVSFKRSGLNTVLPAASNKDSGRDKMSFYDLASSDSAKRLEQVRNDPNLQTKQTEIIPVEVREIPNHNATAIRERIQVYQPNNPQPRTVVTDAPPTVSPPAKQIDPDLEAINQTIEKLAALQNPAKATEKTVVENDKNAMAVIPNSGGDEKTYFGKKSAVKNTLEFLNEKTSHTAITGSIAAIIPTEQELQTGSVVKIQLSQPVTISGNVIPAGTSVHGKASIENERVFIKISSIQSGGSVYPISMSVFDLDGIEGLNAPGSIARDVMKSTAEQSLQSVNVLSMDPSIKTQALTAGIGAAKSLLSKKVKIVKATIPAGYAVLLQDNKAK